MEEFNLDEEIDKNDELTEKIHEKKSLITFAKLNKFFLIPFLFAIFIFISNLLEIIIGRTKVIRNSEFITTVFYDLPYVLAGLFYLFFIPLFSKIILKENIYKHHYFSLLISLIGIIFLIIPICLHLKGKDIIPNILNFIRGINYPLFLILIKYVIEKYYISPLKIAIEIGIISIIFNLIVYIIYSLIIDDF